MIVGEGKIAQQLKGTWCQHSPFFYFVDFGTSFGTSTDVSVIESIRKFTVNLVQISTSKHVVYIERFIDCAENDCAQAVMRLNELILKRPNTTFINKWRTDYTKEDIKDIIFFAQMNEKNFIHM